MNNQGARNLYRVAVFLYYSLVPCIIAQGSEAYHFYEEWKTKKYLHEAGYMPSHL